MPFDIKITAAPDLASVDLEMPQKIRATAAELDELILIFSHIRAQVKPAYPSEAPAVDPKGQIINPLWKAWPAESNAVNLQVQHPGFGWLPFYLPRVEAAKLGTFLQEASKVTQASAATN